MNIFMITFALQVFAVSGQTWARRATLINFSDYFRNTLGQVTLELEKREWCNLKIDDLTVLINEHMYNWHVTGNLKYTQGFLISIQRIDLSNIERSVNDRVLNGTTQAIGMVRGFFNFRNPKVGFDVLFQLNDGSVQRYTSVFTYSLIHFQCTIEKNFHTGAITTIVNQMHPSALRHEKMMYLPTNNVTEVLSRTFTPSSISRSFTRWGEEIIQPILLNVVTSKMEFPSVCFVNC